MLARGDGGRCRDMRAATSRPPVIMAAGDCVKGGSEGPRAGGGEDLGGGVAPERRDRACLADRQATMKWPDSGPHDGRRLGIGRGIRLGASSNALGLAMEAGGGWHCQACALSSRPPRCSPRRRGVRCRRDTTGRPRRGPTSPCGRAGLWASSSSPSANAARQAKWAPRSACSPTARHRSSRARVAPSVPSRSKTQTERMMSSHRSVRVAWPHTKGAAPVGMRCELADVPCLARKSASGTALGTACLAGMCEGGPLG